MKALHPSDHEIKAARVPGGTDNTVVVAIDQVFNTSLTNTEETFGLFPNLMTPFVRYNGTASLPTDTFTPPWLGGDGWSATTIGGATLNSMDGFVGDNIEAYRITSESVTFNFIAPATANQGTVIAAQLPNRPQIMWVMQDLASPEIWPSEGYNNRGLWKHEVHDKFPIKSEMLSGTRAYNAKAIDGCYLPLRLSNFEWHSLADNMVRQRGVMKWHNTEINTPFFPMVSDLELVPISQLKMQSPIGANMWQTGDIGETYGLIKFYGHDQTAASVQIRFRMTVEFRTNAGTTMAPMAQAPPLPDELAIKMYKEIAGRMKNAYPASYNDWDGLKKTILTIGKDALKFADPMIHLLTSGLPMGGAIASLATSVTDGLRRKMESSATVKQLEEQESKARKEAFDAVTAAVKKAAGQPKRQRRRKRNNKGKPAQAPTTQEAKKAMDSFVNSVVQTLRKGV